MFHLIYGIKHFIQLGKVNYKSTITILINYLVDKF